MYMADNGEAALDYIHRLSQETAAKLVVRSDQEVFHQAPVDNMLEGLGAKVQVMARESPERGQL